jgi:hypothetical protein
MAYLAFQGIRRFAVVHLDLVPLHDLLFHLDLPVRHVDHSVVLLEA